MDLRGEYRIPASRERVWEMLNDPDVLRACIPGCESLEPTDDGFAATVNAKIGPIKAKFKGSVAIEDSDPPHGYALVGEGKGGVAGFAKGRADVKLREDGDETVLNYEADAKVGGKIAQLGSRLIDSTVKKLADKFFGDFSEMAGGKMPEKVSMGTTVSGDPAVMEAADDAPSPKTTSPGTSTPLGEPAAASTPAPPAPEVPAREPAGTDAPEAVMAAAQHDERATMSSDPNLSDAPLATPPIVGPGNGSENSSNAMLMGSPLIWGLLALAVLVSLILIF